MLDRGGLVPAAATRDVAGANDPLMYLQVLARALPRRPRVAVAMIVFAAILPRAWNEPSGRRAQAVAVWGIGFGLAMIAVPAAFGIGAGQTGSKWPWWHASRL